MKEKNKIEGNELYLELENGRKVPFDTAVKEIEEGIEAKLIMDKCDVLSEFINKKLEQYNGPDDICDKPSKV